MYTAVLCFDSCGTLPSLKLFGATFCFQDVSWYKFGARKITFAGFSYRRHLAEISRINVQVAVWPRLLGNLFFFSPGRGCQTGQITRFHFFAFMMFRSTHSVQKKNDFGGVLVDIWQESSRSILRLPSRHVSADISIFSSTEMGLSNNVLLSTIFRGTKSTLLRFLKNPTCCGFCIPPCCPLEAGEAFSA